MNLLLSLPSNSSSCSFSITEAFPQDLQRCTACDEPAGRVQYAGPTQREHGICPTQIRLGQIACLPDVGPAYQSFSCGPSRDAMQ